MEKDFAKILADTALDLRAQQNMQTTVQSVVDLAAIHLRGRAEVSVALVTGKTIDTAATTSPRAEKADRLQFEVGEGPCVDAIWEHETFQIEDLEVDRRYPK